MLPGATASAAATNNTLITKIAPASDVTTTSWTKGGTCASGFYQCVSDDPDSPDDTNYDLGPKATNTSNAITFGLGSMPADFLAAQSVEIRVRAAETGGVDDTETATYQVLDSSGSALTNASGGAVLTSTLTTSGYNVGIAAPQNNNATTWNSARLKITSTWAQVNTVDSNIQAKVTAIEVKITYITTNFTKLTQDGYIFENDDGVNVNSDTAQAAGNTALTNVTKGERLTVRMQLKNTGAALDSSRQLGLFYDDNNGYFTKVKSAAQAVTGTGTCGGDTAWNCTTIDTNTTGRGKYTSVAIAPDGRPWIAYNDNAGTARLFVAQFVGAGGTGCANSTAWDCTQITNTTGASNGQGLQIAFDPNGVPWIAYYQSSTAVDEYVAKYTPGAGTGCGATGSTDWTCTGVEVDGATTDRGQYTSMGFDLSGNPWIVYQDGTNFAVRYARYVSSGGTGCAGGTTQWTCAYVDVGGASTYGQGTQIRFDPSGPAWVSYNASGKPKIAKYVGSGGTGCSTGITAWTCTQILSSSGMSARTTLAIDSAGNPWMGWQDQAGGNSYMEVANYVGSGGNCSGSTAFNCTDVDEAGLGTGQYASLGLAPNGSVWAVYESTYSGGVGMRLARYVGGTSGSGCGAGGSTAWTCTNIEDSNHDSQYTSLAFDQSGVPWISHFDATSPGLRISTLDRGGELTISPSLAGSNGSSITSSHADMTSATDSANKSDADCLTATTWNNGMAFDTETATGLSIPAGSSTSQCTEIAFTIDTSQATVGTTYRLVIATNDRVNNDRGMWRGPISVVNYATFTVQSAMTIRDSKDNQFDMSNCTDTNWGCATIDQGDSMIGFDNSMAFDNQGNPWISTIDQSAGTLRVTHYVGGSGGSGCTSAAWTCTVVDNVLTATDEQTSLGIDANGNPWVSYYDNVNKALKVARYVTSGGTGCSSSAWTCVTVDVTDQTGEGSSLGVGRNGNIWVSYTDETAGTVRVAHYVGGGGTGCSSSAWTCVTVDGDASTWFASAFTSLAFDQFNNPYVATVEWNSNSLRLDHYVGTGGSGCGASGTNTWTCTEIDNAGTDGSYASLAIDGSGNMWIGERDSASGYARVAHYVGSSGTGCGAGGSTAWTCTTVDSSGTDGQFMSVALDASGAPWMSYLDNSTGKLRVAKYVGSGGNCTSTAWTCTTVDSTTWVGAYSALAFDRSGTPWVVYDSGSPDYLRVAKLHQPPTPLGYTSANTIAGGRNAAWSDGRYHLDAGTSPRGQTGACGATSNQQGYCGITRNGDGYADTENAAINENAVFETAMYETSNAVSPTIFWTGQSNVAPSSRYFTVQFYRFGSTNAWENTIPDVDTCSSAAANTPCSIQTTALNTVSDYYKADGAGYWVYVRIFQAYSTTGTESMQTDSMYLDQAPNGLGFEVQMNTAGDTTISTGAWWNQTTLTFSAFGSDTDTTDSISLCVEAKPINQAFTNTNDACGTPVASTSGNATAISVQDVLTNGTQYHWQARVKDADGLYTIWTIYGGNSDGSPPGTPADADVGIDTTAPSTGTVYDGSSAGVESHYNNGSLSSLSANWTGFSDATSGIASYDYSIGVSAGDTSVKGWTNTASTSFTASGLTLHTSQMYYLNVRAKDNAGNVSAVVSSSGQQVAPTLTFTVSTSALNFAALNAGDSYTNSQTLTLTTSTNAYNGYTVGAYEAGPLTYGANSISDYASSISSPTTWSGNGFGYNVSGGSAIAAFSGSKYAHFGTSASPDTPVAHAGTISGSPISNEVETVTMKVQVPSSQAAGAYRTSLIWSCVASY